jgi:hypothetical protein
MTRTGKPVPVTDKGKPLWMVSLADGTRGEETERRRAIEAIFEEALRERPSTISASRLLEESRR